MEHIVKLRKIALADIEAEQLKIKAAKEANRKRASMIVKVGRLLFFVNMVCSRSTLILCPGKTCVYDFKFS
jgi:hypothetical protein